MAGRVAVDLAEGGGWLAVGVGDGDNWVGVGYAELASCALVGSLGMAATVQEEAAMANGSNKGMRRPIATRRWLFIHQTPERLILPAHAPNGLELSCPAEAGNHTWTLGHDGGQGKDPRRPSPPGQLQRVVRLLAIRASGTALRKERPSATSTRPFFGGRTRLDGMRP